MISQLNSDDFYAALDADDLDPGRIKELCENPTLIPSEAQEYLVSVIQRGMNVDIIRALLSNGASAEELSLTYLQSCRSLEMLQLLAEDGLDFKDEGHKILEYGYVLATE